MATTGANYPMKCRFGGKPCGTFPNAVALRKHYDTAHADVWTPKPKRPKPTKALAVVVKTPAVPTMPPLGVDDLDVVVLGVVEQITRSVPVDLLPAVFAWREATAAFLAAVDARRP
jgi:hypothetical protein